MQTVSEFTKPQLDRKTKTVRMFKKDEPLLHAVTRDLNVKFDGTYTTAETIAVLLADYVARVENFNPDFIAFMVQGEKGTVIQVRDHNTIRWADTVTGQCGPASPRPSYYARRLLMEAANTNTYWVEDALIGTTDSILQYTGGTKPHVPQAQQQEAETE